MSDADAPDEVASVADQPRVICVVEQRAAIIRLTVPRRSTALSTLRRRIDASVDGHHAGALADVMTRS